MLFNALPFWIFFPSFFVLYFATRERTRLFVCLIGSYLFYGWWDYRFLVLIALLTGLNFYCGLKINNSDASDKKTRKQVLLVSVCCSLGILAVFKYANFFVDSLAVGLASMGVTLSSTTLDIILPVGISFYTFQTMSYTIDLYRRQISVERDWLRFAVFVSFFPQLVAGPIVRAKTFLPQLQRDATVSIEDLHVGIHQVLWGLILKVVVADNLATVADLAFANPATHSASFLSIGVIFYTFQIYGDFAGYSLMAIGFARLLGFHFDQNFDRPYFAKSFSEFWTRWHISLSSWLRDYLYIPLGGNRISSLRTQGNLMTTMLLGGLWHGAAWTFVFWGFLHGGLLIIQRMLAPLFRWVPNRIRNFLAWLAVMFAVMLGWVFFRAQSFDDAATIISIIATADDFTFQSILRKFYVVKGAVIIAILFGIEALSFKMDYSDLAIRRPMLTVPFCIFSLVTISALGMFGGSTFIYFQF